MTDEQKLFEEIKKLTEPINGQYPRPWTTNLPHPMDAEGMIVGMNQATSYLVTDMSHEKFLNAHFGKGLNSYDLYRSVRSEESKTRINIEVLAACLKRPLLESDVICYSTPRAKHLSNAEHRGGKERGIAIFKTVFGFIQPSFTVVWGKAAQTEFLSAVKRSSTIRDQLIEEEGFAVYQMKFDRATLHPGLNGAFNTKVFFIRSIAWPEWAKWKNDAPRIFGKIRDQLGKAQ
jgi:hypothetical protein